MHLDLFSLSHLLPPTQNHRIRLNYEDTLLFSVTLACRFSTLKQQPDHLPEAAIRWCRSLHETLPQPAGQSCLPDHGL